MTIAQQPKDVINESSRAYAIAVTPERRYCVFGDANRSYRVVNSHGVRRVDGIVTTG